MKQTNQIYVGSNNRKSLYDLSIPENFNNHIVLLIHGYKGFKDWGAWNLMEQQFVQNGYGFCKFNLSHNGGTTDQPMDFPDINAFANNCFSYQVFDTKAMISLLTKQFPQAKIELLGHSRGGAVAMLCANEEKVQAVITMASVCSFKKRFENKNLEQWKKNGVRFELNSRLNIEMPQNYSILEDFLAHEKELDVENPARKLQKPCLHFHGSNDTSIDISEAIDLASWSKSPLYVVENANHTFNITHPWHEKKLSNELQFVVDQSLHFLNNTTFNV